MPVVAVELCRFPTALHAAVGARLRHRTRKHDPPAATSNCLVSAFRGGRRMVPRRGACRELRFSPAPPAVRWPRDRTPYPMGQRGGALLPPISSRGEVLFSPGAVWKRCACAARRWQLPADSAP